MQSDLDPRDPIILAIDQGTTGTTCVLHDAQLNPLSRAYAELPQHFPRPGWVEHDPEQIWQSVCRTIQEAIARANVDPRRIAAIGITNQRETCLIWDRHDPCAGWKAALGGRDGGSTGAHAIVWQDRRTSDACEKLREEGLETWIQRTTGLVLDPYFSATKLAWLLDHIPNARSDAAAGKLAAGTIDCYLLWRLTHGATFATDITNAARTSLWALDAKAGSDSWDADLCSAFRVPPEILPTVLPCTGALGTTRNVPGLPDGIPICGMAGDQQAALIGQACFQPGMAKCTYGTGAFVVLHTGKIRPVSRHRLLVTVAWQIGDELAYAIEGSAFMAGALVQWLRDGLGFFAHSHEIEALAASVADSGEVVVVPAHTGLGAPHWRADARGLIAGLSRGSTRAHICRAALEGIAHEVCDLLDAMAADIGSTSPIRELRVDGGAAANDLLMQIQSDFSGLALARPSDLETTALGATFLAGLGAQIWRDVGELTKAWQCARRFEPSAARQFVAQARARWRSALACA